MKPAPFAYRRAASLDELFATLREFGDEAQILAGGQSLVPMLNMRIARPAILVDINRITAIDYLRREDGVVELGALTRWRGLEDWPETGAALPLLAAALPLIAHPAIRNRGTVGGSLALADPAAELPAVALALGGEMVLASAAARRTVKVEDFFQGLYQTALAPEEAIIAVRLSAPRPGERFAIYEVARRQGDYALAGAAIAAGAGGCRVAVFGVADRAMLSPAAATLADADPAAPAAAFADALAQDIVFLGDREHPAPIRRHLAGVAVRRALDRLAAPA
ncbi:MAG TPA: FAD binding domain-containing protein [Stellaceae bacterium]|nr:FAD binding domain-containing protein [Stellaceae bacterium]